MSPKVGFGVWFVNKLLLILLIWLHWTRLVIGEPAILIASELKVSDSLEACAENDFQ